jgi:site-specific recombinase XerD
VADFLAALGAHQAPTDDGVTVGTYAVDWLRRRVGIAPATMRYYQTQVVNGILGDPDLSQTKLAELTRDHVEHWLARMERKGLGASAQNARLKVLRMVCTAAVRNPTIAILADPTAGIRRRKSDLKPRAFMSDADVEAVLGDEPEFRLAVLLGVDAGLRWEEITALAASSVMTRGRDMTIRVWQSVDRHGVVRNTTKNGKERTVPILTKRLQEALSLAAKKARLRSGPDGLILEEDGHPLRYEHWTRAKLKPAYAQAGIWPQPVGWHDLRHTYGSKLAENGTPTKIIATLMGHSDQRVTELYMHESSMETMRTVMANAFGGL